MVDFDIFVKIGRARKLAELEEQKAMSLFYAMERVQEAAKQGRDDIAKDELKAVKAVTLRIQEQIDRIKAEEI